MELISLLLKYNIFKAASCTLHSQLSFRQTERINNRQTDAYTDRQIGRQTNWQTQVDRRFIGVDPDTHTYRVRKKY